MNRPIARVYAFVLVLFATLVGFTSYWSVFAADDLRDEQVNRRPLLEEQQIKRGKIETADGLLVARSVPQGRGEDRFFTRAYPQGELFGNPVGYDFVSRGRVGIERSENEVLIGERNEFASILDELVGEEQVGSDLTITLDSGAQRVARDALAGRPGAVVALEPSTGAVRAMVSVPGYDPNQVPDRFRELNSAPDSPLFNRPTQAGYAPGSTMKVVTAAAALDSGEFTPESVLNGSSPQEIGGVPLENFGNAQFGDITLTEALTNSVNTVFAQVGEQLGDETLFRYMTRFGFNAKPALDFPPDQMAVSGVFDGNELLRPGDGVDVGRVAIGQERLRVTPLQMAEVAATVANRGALERPTFLQQVTDPDGRVAEELDPEQQAQVIGESTAAELAEMMGNVTREGTAAGLSVGGVPFGGKTGTAERESEECSQNQAWFIGFAPLEDPQVAVAATVECTAGVGGEVAGPIATAVMEELLR